MSAPGFGDIRDRPSPDQDSTDPLVLGGISDSHGQAWGVRPASATSARSFPVRDCVDDAAQTPPGDGDAAREPLHGEIEIDDTWVGGEQAGLQGSRQLKQRRAALVLVAVEKRGRASGRVRMNVIPDFKAGTIIPIIARNVAPGSTLYTDGLKS